MSRNPKNTPSIRLRGVRHNNLKGFDLDLPLHRLIVITGLSGSGKSSLAFDTLYAEGQRRYIETFSPYTRQFFDRMDKPQVDSIEGIPPAIAIEQRNTVKTTRSTVGTMTEICEHMKQAWPLVATLFCRQCSRPVTRETPQKVWETVQDQGGEVLVTFDVPLTKKLPLKDSLDLIAKQGYQRLLVQARTGLQPVTAGIGGCADDEIPSGNQSFSLHEATTHEYRTACERTATNLVPAASRPSGPRDTVVAPARPYGTEEADALSAGRMPATRSTWTLLRLEDAPDFFRRQPPASLTVIQDRVKLAPANRARFVEACEQAYHFGKGHLRIHWLDEPAGVELAALRSQNFSKHFHCAACDIEYREPTPALFSFNHPVGACPKCKGFGRVIQIDYNLAIPDRSLSLNAGAVKPWRSGTGAESQRDLAKFCQQRRVSMDVPFRDLPEATQRWVIDGDPDYGKDEDHQWPKLWYGVKGYFRWLESKAYKMHVRVLLAKYRAYVMCPDCQGNRLQTESLLYRLQSENGRSQTAEGRLSLADFYRLSIRDAVRVVDSLIDQHAPKPHEPLGLVLGEVRQRLRYLDEIGLGYLTLDRPTRSLSGGETERVNLTSCLGSRLVNTLYVLDEPSVGLHPRDTARLVKILESLRDAGNTVVVVEHEEGVMRAADQIIDLGPGHGESGGNMVFQGAFTSILTAKGTLTGEFLSGRRTIKVGQVFKNLSRKAGKAANRLEHSEAAENPTDRLPAKRDRPALRVTNATKHNLKNLSVEIPLGSLVCITGVSGSGKSTLVREVLVPLLAEKLGQIEEVAASRDKDADGDEGEEGESSVAGDAQLTGAEHLRRVVLVDQSPIGRTPRSNPAVYVGAFDDIRELFAQTEEAKRRGYNASSFSFNSAQGQCDRCRGAGFEKIEMQFLSDVFIKCPACNGRRYRDHILEVRIQKPEVRRTQSTGHKTQGLAPAWSIADLLDATVDAVVEFLESLPESRFAARAVTRLKLLQEVGLGYLRLGQPINTLSGGECQRLKLVSHLVEAQSVEDSLSFRPRGSGSAENPSTDPRGTLFVFDEPTTGLHFEDVRILLLALHRIAEAGHSVLVVEHHLDVVRNADWVIDLGPGAGDEGGQIVAVGTPEEIARCTASFTGQALSSDLRRAG